MSKQEHSPLPWNVGKFKDVINDVNGYPIIDLWAEGDTHIKDAQFIVEACNNYELLKADNLKLATGFHDELREVKHLKSENQRLRNALEDILGEAVFADKCDTQFVYELAKEALQQEGENQ